MQTLEVMSEVVEGVLRIPDVSLFDLSRNGRYAVFSSNVSGSYQIHCVDLLDGKVVQLSHGDQRVTFAKISPDSKTVYFLRDFHGFERHQLFAVPFDGSKEEEQLSKFDDMRLFDFAVSHDGRNVALSGSTAESNFVWVFDVERRVIQPVFSSAGWIFSPDYSADNKAVAFSANTSGLPRASEIVIHDLENSKSYIYTPKRGSENTGPKWHPKNSKLLFKTNASGIYDLAVYDHDSGSINFLGLSGFGVDFSDFGWLGQGDGFWFVARKNGRSKLYVKHEQVREISVPDGSITGIGVDESGSQAVLSWSSLSNPPAVYRIDLKTNSFSEVYRPPRPAEIRFGKAEFVSYKSFDGLEIPAYLVVGPRGRVPAPCVVWVHGGPWWEVGDEWNAAIQALCVAGFHVLCPNFRGSTGYGAEFERLNIGDPGGGDMQDVINGVRYLYESKLVEDERVGIAGASYGGFMTFLAMTKHPDFWKAGAAIVGITDWVEDYELSDAAFRNFTEQLLGKPDEKPELFYDRSPINFVHQIKAPIFVWHRANDSRCPLQPVEKFVKKLKELGKPHEFHVVEGEGHGVQKLENFVKQYKAVVEFLLKHV